MIFRMLLWLVGIQLSIASRLSARVRGQLARDMTIAVATRDGVARTYVFRGRRVSSYAGDLGTATFTVLFPSAAVGTRIFLAPDAIKQIVEGVASKDIELRGLPAHLLWFYELVMAFAPWRKTRYRAMPNAYVVPNPDSKVADRITREPAEASLDPNWSGAVAQREHLMMWKVGHGEPVADAIKDYRHVADIPAAAREDAS